METPATPLDPVAFRRHLHRNPELSFREEATAAFIGEIPPLGLGTL